MDAQVSVLEIHFHPESLQGLVAGVSTPPYFRCSLIQMPTTHPRSRVVEEHIAGPMTWAVRDKVSARERAQGTGMDAHLATEVFLRFHSRDPNLEEV